MKEANGWAEGCSLEGSRVHELSLVPGEVDCVLAMGGAGPSGVHRVPKALSRLSAGLC